jgi:hypothetical protein
MLYINKNLLYYNFIALGGDCKSVACNELYSTKFQTITVNDTLCVHTTEICRLPHMLLTVRVIDRLKIHFTLRGLYIK